MTDSCRSPSARRGGLEGALGAEPVAVTSSVLGGLDEGPVFPGGAEQAASKGGGLEEGADLVVSNRAGPVASEGEGLLDSGGGTFCRLPCLDAPEPGISQLSVRRLEPSCIRLVATTAFIAACRGQHTHTQTHSEC